MTNIELVKNEGDAVTVKMSHKYMFLLLDAVTAAEAILENKKMEDPIIANFLSDQIDWFTHIGSQIDGVMSEALEDKHKNLPPL